MKGVHPGWTGAPTPDEESPAPLLSVSRRRRSVVYLRTMGYAYDEIAERLGVSSNVVHQDLAFAIRRLVPRLHDDRPTKQPSLFYVLGLLDGGVPPEEVPDRLRALEVRAEYLANRERARDGPNGDEPTDTDAPDTTISERT